MSIEELMTAGSTLLSTFLVLSGVVFAGKYVWPWYAERDSEERERSHQLSLANASVTEAVATQLGIIADNLTTLNAILHDRYCPDDG